MHNVALVDVANADDARATGTGWRERTNIRAVPTTVTVGHSASLVSAGLAATLSRTPGCELSLRQISPAACSCESAQPAELVFGDSTMLKCMQAHNKSLPGTCKFAKAKFVLVTTGYERAPADSKGGQFDESLSLESEEQEIFATVRKLVGLKSVSDEPVIPLASNETLTSQPRDSFPRGGLAPGALRRVREHVDKNLTERLMTEDLAAVAGLSPGHFNRAFRQSIGHAPHQYVLRRRVGVAAQLLKDSDRALADIALEVGFADQSHFTRTYASVTGETPSAYRRRHR